MVVVSQRQLTVGKLVGIIERAVFHLHDEISVGGGGIGECLVVACKGLTFQDVERIERTRSVGIECHLVHGWSIVPERKSFVCCVGVPTAHDGFVVRGVTNGIVVILNCARCQNRQSHHAA